MLGFGPPAVGPRGRPPCAPYVQTSKPRTPYPIPSPFRRTPLERGSRLLTACGSAVESPSIPLGTSCGVLLTVFLGKRYTNSTQRDPEGFSGKKPE